jgi:hypothetical protein
MLRDLATDAQAAREVLRPVEGCRGHKAPRCRYSLSLSLVPRHRYRCARDQDLVQIPNRRRLASGRGHDGRDGLDWWSGDGSGVAVPLAERLRPDSFQG